MNPKVILWDIESSPNTVAVFQLKNNDWIAPANILTERQVICAAWKELGKSKIYSTSILDFPDITDDYGVCCQLHAILREADVIIAHNGDNFDIKFVLTRMLKHGLKPLPPILSIDTLKVAKKHFLFNSNSLNYVGQFLGVGQKTPTSPGLWLRALAGDKAAVKEMLVYNRQDVVLLESVFLKLAPYLSNQITNQFFGPRNGTCPRVTCGSADVKEDGVFHTGIQSYGRFRCNACGGYFREKKSFASTPLRVL